MTFENHYFGLLKLSRNALRHLVMAAALLCGLTAFAQSSNQKIDDDEIGTSPKSRLAGVSKIRTQVQGYLRFEAMQYPTAVAENPQLSQSLLASTNLRGDVTATHNLTAFDISAGKYVNVTGSHFQVNEVYHSLQWRDGQSQLSVGRKIEFWSQLDQDWQMGLWQPKSMLDSLRPEDQGLTGVFYRHQQGRFELLAFGSPIFIPTLGPEIREKNGSLVADSRWYRPPSSSFPLNNKDTRIVFSLDIPPIEKLVRNPGGGLRMRYGGETDGAWVSGNYGYKPMNDLRLKYKKGLFLPEYDPQTGEVTISPEVGYHQIYGADVGYRLREGMVSASYITDVPQNKTAEDPYVIQRPRAMKAYALHGETFVESSFLTSPIGIHVNYLRVDGGDIRDYDAYGEDNGAIFDQRFNFTHAASVRTDFSTLWGEHKFMSSLKYLREFDQKGTLINSEFTYYPQKYIAFILGADIIGVDDTSALNKDGRFLNQFRANDRYYGGMSYVF